MKKVIYGLILLLVVVSGLVYANRGIKNEVAQKLTPKQATPAEMNAERKSWEATPAGIAFKKWEASPKGQKVLAGEAKIRKQISSFTDMEAVITSLTLPPGSRLGFGVMARINGEDFILSFGHGNNNDYHQLYGLKVNDKIIIRSRSVSHAPKYLYPIVSGDYVERDGKIIYERVISKDGC